MSLSINGASILELIRNIAPNLNDMSDEDIALLSESLLEVEFANIERTDQYSVIGGATRLWDLDNHFPAILIILFSVLFPIFKLLVTFAVAFGGQFEGLNKALTAVHRLSMLDIFVVAIIVFVISRTTGYVVDFQIGFYVFITYFFAQMVTSILVSRTPQDQPEWIKT